MSQVAWGAVLLRHVVVCLARSFYGTHEEFEAALGRLRAHLDHLDHP